MRECTTKQGERPLPDAELNRMRSLAALEAMHSIFESLPVGTEIRSEHIAALLDVALAVARDGRAVANDRG